MARRIEAAALATTTYVIARQAGSARTFFIPVTKACWLWSVKCFLWLVSAETCAAEILERSRSDSARAPHNARQLKLLRKEGRPSDLS